MRGKGEVGAALGVRRRVSCVDRWSLGGGYPRPTGGSRAVTDISIVSSAPHIEELLTLPLKLARTLLDLTLLQTQLEIPLTELEFFQLLDALSP